MELLEFILKVFALPFFIMSNISFLGVSLFEFVLAFIFVSLLITFLRGRA